MENPVMIEREDLNQLLSKSQLTTSSRECVRFFSPPEACPFCSLSCSSIFVQLKADRSSSLSLLQRRSRADLSWWPLQFRWSRRQSQKTSLCSVYVMRHMLNIITLRIIEFTNEMLTLRIHSLRKRLTTSSHVGHNILSMGCTLGFGT
ncbi:uncharacterized protein LOC129289319 [Prosopis cineraria]|uniref:uncharacterized protein LOC129289319 n=1 Tax=Prosopis cineraria TaxID=364024 RepID=UPI00240F33BE|nr:uncharacterized protein LOC129289319 [Prosopis cineraria]